jgi:tRNA(fMet)-specific endonuclease VapC
MVKLRYLLDTNICIYIVKHQPPAVIERFAKCKIGEGALSSVTWAELCCGIGRYNKRDEMAALFGKLSPVNFDMETGEIFGELSRKFPNKKSSFDRMIAAHAIRLDVTLVTNNTADFQMYEAAGLRLENWVSGA